MDKILLIDDDMDILTINEKYLESIGYEVLMAESAEVGLSILSHTQVDCILLDVMLPGYSGFEACTLIKELSSAPILFLSGRSAEDDRVRGLITGADDYITKPYSLKELGAKIYAHIRSSKRHVESVSMLSFPPLFINVINRDVIMGETSVALTPKEYEILMYMAKRINKVVTFENLFADLWKDDAQMDKRSIVVHVNSIRKKLSVAPYEDIQFIRTIWREGYIFKYPPERVEK